MWTDAGADAARCTASGEPGSPARRLDDGWPDGRALCPVCQRFVDLDTGGRLITHDTSDPAETEPEAERRREWFNTFGW